MLAYADYDRQETINGVIYMMSPSPTINHNYISGNIYHIFRSYLNGKRCRAFMDGVDVHLDKDNIVIPDSFIVCNRDIIKPDGIYGAPDLIVEVLSPSTAKRDKLDKKAVYESHGVKEYWIVSPNEKNVDVYLLNEAGRLELDNSYTVIPEWLWNKMTEEQKSAAQLFLKVSLYDDLIIDLKAIFENVE